MVDFLGDTEMNSLWSEYNHTRLTGDKQTANRLLVDFIAVLKRKDDDTIKTFVDSVCNDALNHSTIIANNGLEVSNQATRIQHQLFKGVILPVLVDQYKKDSAIHIKWIAQLEQFFYSDNDATQVKAPPIKLSSKSRVLTLKLGTNEKVEIHREPDHWHSQAAGIGQGSC